MKKTIIAIAITMVALVARGEDFESCVDITHAVPMPGAQAFAITSLTLPAGHWAVSGTINIYENAQKGTVFAGGSVSTEIAVDMDGHTAYPSLQLDHPTNVTMSVTPSRVYRNPDGPITVYLVAWSNQPGQPPLDAIAWGCITAVRP